MVAHTFEAPRQTPRLSLQARAGWLHSPVIDFLGLGGGSLIALVLAAVFLDPETMYGGALVGAMWLAHVINHPHFAHSYQIFYANFPDKLRGRGYAPGLRARYWFAGVVAPVGLAAAFSLAYAIQSAAMLAGMVNVMFFLVGWHYVKQGYGMAMLDAVLKKRFYSGTEKKILLVNGYATWICAWIYLNVTLDARDFWGLNIPVFAIPEPLFHLSIAAAAASFMGVLAAGVRRLAVTRTPPAWNGLVAYAASLYPWLLFRDVNIVYFAFVPAFHSLQYMTVVWRYKLNEFNADADANAEGRSPVKRVAVFYALAAVIGLAGFWGAPVALSMATDYGKAALGAAVFLIIVWAFINVHHYLMDNVMWRKGNPDVAARLFNA
ncbi:MAG: hypothetical protein AAGC56_08635 [Pseudomonadota bacterium]